MVRKSTPFMRWMPLCLTGVLLLACLLIRFGIPAPDPVAQTASAPASPIKKKMPPFYAQAKERLTYPLAWGNAPEKEFLIWRQQARDQLIACMGLLPPAPTAFDMEVLAQETRTGYTALKIAFNISAWSRVNAYLLVPDGSGPFPALVALHDHGAHFTIGKEKLVRPIDASPEVVQDALQWVDACYDGVFVGDYFAQHGYVVLATDALFWGERSPQGGSQYEDQQALAANLMQLGMTFFGVIAGDDMQSARFLTQQPLVDASRVGALGFSMGAYRAWMLSAASDQVKASAAVCWINTTDSLMTLTNNQAKGGSSFSMLLPAMSQYFDYPHVASIACPKPALFFNGTRDKLFPANGVEDAYQTLHQVWASQGVEERLVTRLWDTPHTFDRRMQEAARAFFDQWLRP